MSGWLLMGGPASDSSMGVLVVGLVTVLVDRRIDESFPVDFLSFRRHQNGPRARQDACNLRVPGTLFEEGSTRCVCGTQSLPWIHCNFLIGQ